jgi:phosphatidylserine/phosphatidylglycerophosphate/cardiolipin synthase-like enzyme
VLQQLRVAIESGLVRPPVDRAALVGFGIKHQLEAIENALSGHKRAACLAILDVALAEREQRRPAPELVWTGPEAQAGEARDTAIVLRELFESARESVILAGYDFTRGRDLLRPLHTSMLDHGVDARFIVHVPQIDPGQRVDGYLESCLGGFFTHVWPFGEPRPPLYYDTRALVAGPPYSTMHAKCVVVDGIRAFISSANFTERAHERNIEVGVLIEDASFASYLAGQWLSLIEAGMLVEYASPH